MTIQELADLKWHLEQFIKLMVVTGVTTTVPLAELKEDYINKIIIEELTKGKQNGNGN